MANKRQLKLFIFLIGLLEVFFKANGEESQTLKVAISQWPENLHPLLLNDESKAHARGYLNLPVFTLDKEFKWICRLCKELPSYANSLLRYNPQAPGKNHLRMTIELKDDLQWSDGKPVTGYDFLFTWKVANSSEEESFLPINAFQHIASVNVDPGQPKKFYIFLNDPYLAFYHLRHLYLLPKHLEESVWIKAKKNFDVYISTSSYTLEPTKPGLYLGPMVVGELKNKAEIKLKNNIYSPFKMAVSDVMLQVMPIFRLDGKTSKFDIISESYDSLTKLDPDTVKEICNFSEYKIFYGDSNYLEALVFNMRSNLLKNRELRMTLAGAIDKKEIIDEIYQESVMPAWGIEHSQSYLFNPTAISPSFDQQRAMELLDNLRWKKGGDGIRIKDGEKLVFSIRINEKKERIKIAEVIKRNLNAIGASVQLEEQNNSLFTAQTIEHADFSDMVLVTLYRPVNYSLAPLFHKDHIPNVRNSYKGANIGYFSDTQLSEWLESVDNELRDNEKKIIMTKIQSHLNEQMPIVPLFFYMRGVVAKKNWDNIFVPPDYYPTSIWADEWRIIGSES